MRHFLITISALAFSAILLGSFAACSAQPSVACLDAGDCPSADSPQACVENECVAVDCLVNTDCEIGHVCDTAEGAYSCERGCEEDTDCLSGFQCSGGSCVERACRSSILDCDFGEICNSTSGVCSPAGGYHCTPCDSFNDLTALPDPFDLCSYQVFGNSDCGGNGNHCVAFQANSPTYCTVACSSQADCPAGFNCSGFVYTLAGETCVIEAGPVCIPSSGCP